ncbi:hypothetical protein F4808DRAFT_45769 [Astrocystis sublimbata]|nr:hypothetical protein F4808DRAFT_45769 [Astrocystis sublimbata]
MAFVLLRFLAHQILAPRPLASTGVSSKCQAIIQSTSKLRLVVGLINNAGGRNSQRYFGMRPMAISLPTHLTYFTYQNHRISNSCSKTSQVFHGFPG